METSPSLEEGNDGSVTIGLNGGDMTICDDGIQRKVRNRYLSAHASRNTDKGNLIKSTTGYVDGSKSCIHHFTDAVVTNRHALLMANSPSDMRSTEYSLERKNEKDLFSLGHFDPSQQTPVVMLFLSHRDGEFAIPENRRGVWFKLSDFQISVIWSFHPIPQDNYGVSFFPFTMRRDDGGAPLPSAVWDQDGVIEAMSQFMFMIANARVDNAARFISPEIAEAYARRLGLNIQPGSPPPRAGDER